MRPNELCAEILEDAIDKIAFEGWRRGNGKWHGYTLFTAIVHAEREHSEKLSIYAISPVAHVGITVGMSVSIWNDKVCQNKRQAIKALRDTVEALT